MLNLNHSILAQFEFIPDASDLKTAIINIGALFLLLMSDRIIKWLTAKLHESSLASNSRRSREIHTQLAMLLSHTRGVRCHLQLFKNGEFFSNRTSSWKVCRTLEVTANGYASESMEMQNVIADQLWLILDVLLTPTSEQELPPGAERLAFLDDRASLVVFLFTVSRLPDGFVKSMLDRHGVTHLAVAPLTRGHSRTVDGYVGVDFACESLETDEKNKLSEVARIANIVAYLYRS